MNKTSENVWFSSEFSRKLSGGEESPLRKVSAVISNISVVVGLSVSEVSEINISLVVGLSVLEGGGSTSLSPAIFSTKLPIIRLNSEEVVSVPGGSVVENNSSITGSVMSWEDIPAGLPRKKQID